MRLTVRDLAAIVTNAVCYVLAAELAFALHHVHGLASLIWPSTAIGIALVWYFGDRAAWGIAVGALVMILDHGRSPYDAIWVSAVDAGEAIATVHLLRAFQFSSALSRPRDVVLLVAASCVTSVASATASVGYLFAHRSLFAYEFSSVWTTWWWGHLGSDLIVLPVLLTWFTAGRVGRAERRRARVYEGLALAGALAAVTAAVFRWIPDSVPGARATFALFPPLLWAGLRFSPRVASVASLALDMAAIAATVAGVGPFVDELVDLQAFIALASITTLVLSAASTQRALAQREALSLLEHKVTERTTDLRRRDELLSDAQALSHLGSFEYDAARDHFECSDELYRIFGRAPGKPATYKAWLDCVHPDDRTRVREVIDRVLAGQAETDFEQRIVRPDGQTRVLLSRAKLYDAEANRTARLVCCCQDVTEQSSAQAAQFRLAALVASSEDAIVGLSLDGTIESWNAGAAHIFGYESAEVIGKPASMLVAPDRISEVQKVLTAVRSGTRSAQYELPHRRRDGTTFDGQVTTSAIADEEGRLLGLSKVVRDITERKRANEQLRASLAEKEVLLREIHHRVKNNMQVVSSLIALQVSTAPSEEARRDLIESQNRIQSMALVHQLLYQSGDFAHLDLREYVFGLVQRLVRTYSVGSVDIHTTIDIPKLQLDLDQAIPCGLIINELVSNALIHAFVGRHRGEVGVAMSVHDGKIALEVRDDGIGLPPTLDLASTHTFGLLIARNLTQQLHGTMELLRGTGTIAHIEFPADAQAVTNGHSRVVS